MNQRCRASNCWKIGALRSLDRLPPSARLPLQLFAPCTHFLLAFLKHTTTNLMFSGLLPSTLLFYLFTTTPFALAQERIPLDSLVSLTSQTLNSNSNTTFTLPAATSLTISLSICSFSARFFVTNNTDSATREVRVDEGMSTFSGRFEDGGTLVVDTTGGGGSGTVQVGASESGEHTHCVRTLFDSLTWLENV